MSESEMIRALIDSGMADDAKSARAMLVDMGEIDE